MKRKTKQIAPIKTATKLRRPILTESEIETTEMSSNMDTPAAIRKLNKGSIFAKAKVPSSRRISRGRQFSDMEDSESEASSTTTIHKKSPSSRQQTDPLTEMFKKTNAISKKSPTSKKASTLQTVKGTDNEIPIAKNHHHSTISTDQPKSRSPAKTSASKASVPSQSINVSPTIIEDLKRKFQELSMLRTTEAESLLAEYRKGAETRISSAEKLIESLRKENALLKQQQQQQQQNQHQKQREEIKKPNRDSDISIISRNDDTTRLYKGMCGLDITSENEDENTWHCKLAGKLGDFTFDLAFDQDEKQYSYSPTFSPTSDIASRLPAYLLEEIAFDSDQLQLFFWRALNFLMNF